MKLFSTNELKIIYERVRFRKTTDELSMLIYVIMFTGLKVSDILGWFNNDLGKRRKVLKQLNILEEYESVVKLFTKKHQTYLLQWKKACESWIGRKLNATFEALRQSCYVAKKNGYLKVHSDTILFETS